VAKRGYYRQDDSTVTLVTRALAAAAVFLSRASRIFVYLGVGSQRLDTLRDASRVLWQDFNAAPQDVAAGLAPVERELFERWVPPASRILVVGSGTGRDLIALAGQGHTLWGVEPSTRAIELSRRFLDARGLTATLVPGFFEDVAPGGPFDAVIFSYFCYGYVPVSARRVRLLRKAAGLLAPGGRLLVSYTVMERPHDLLPRLANLSAAVTGSDWRLEPGDSVSLRLERPAGPLFFFEHAFTVQEVLDELAAAELQVVHHRTEVDYPWVVCAPRERAAHPTITTTPGAAP
jgi:SAM-dependent methyltransferase